MKKIAEKFFIINFLLYVNYIGVSFFTANSVWSFVFFFAIGFFSMFLPTQ